MYSDFAFIKLKEEGVMIPSISDLICLFYKLWRRLPVNRLSKTESQDGPVTRKKMLLVISKPNLRYGIEQILTLLVSVFFWNIAKT